MTNNKLQKWSIVRLVTIKKKEEMARLLFATVTDLVEGRPLPISMPDIDPFNLKGSKESLFFRRVLLSTEDAISWYTSLAEGEIPTPIPTRMEDRKPFDGLSIRVTKLEDIQPWPAFGLPIREELFSRSVRSIDPAPFIGSVPGRMHRRFGENIGLEAFLDDDNAQKFVARRMHINLFDYQEYLGSVVYISPDPIVRQIDSFMVPAKGKRVERIIYRIVPHPGQNLNGVRLTTFDKEARLLTSFETRSVPIDGILDVEKGTCMGEYGFVVTHDLLGVLAYQPSAPFLREMNLNLRVNSGNRRTVSVPLNDSPESPRIEYQAAMGSELVSESTLGGTKIPNAGVRVAVESRKRERLTEAMHYGQRWFAEGSRDKAAQFIQELLRSARSKVIIADPYLGALQLGQFLYAVHGSEVNVTLLTTKLAFNPRPSETKLDLLEEFKKQLDDLYKYQQLTPKVRVISSSSLHDRFLVVDRDVWFMGNSLNGLGDKASMIVKLPDPNEVIDQLQILDTDAIGLDDYITRLSKAGIEQEKK